MENPTPGENALSLQQIVENPSRTYTRVLGSTCVASLNKNINNTKTTGQQTVTFALSGETVTDSRPSYEPNTIRPGVEESIANFLKRPVLVATYTWATASATTTYNPLSLWLAVDSVGRKVSDYRYIRGKWKVKFVITGNPKTYGRLLCSFRPQAGADGEERDTSGTVDSIRLWNIMQRYQLPHVRIDPSSSNNYEVTLPTTSTTGWYETNMITPSVYWLLTVEQQNALLTSSAGAVPDCAVQIYVWCEDVELSVPILNPQSDIDSTEGMISDPATAVSNVFGVLTQIPQIAPFATVGMILSSGVATIARLFGYSRPAILSDTRIINNTSTNNWSFTSGGPESLYRLVGDPKQGLAVTADAAGVGSNDDMSFANIVTRPGYFETVLWTTSSTGILKTKSVSPVNAVPYTAVQTGASTASFGLTPLDFIALAHDYWSGTIVYRIEVVCTPFHRGILKILHNPLGSVAASTDTNMYHSVIMDISGTTCVDFEVPWATHRPFLRCPIMQNVFYDENYHNGEIEIVVLTPLGTDGSTSSAYINLYVYAKSDITFARPNLLRLAGYTPISNLDTECERVYLCSGGGEIVPSPIVSDTLGPGPLLRLCFGESHNSINQLCKRATSYILVWTGIATAGTDEILMQWTIPNFPIMPANRVQIPAAYWLNWTFPSYFAIAFMSRRGGVRFHVQPNHPTNREMTEVKRCPFYVYTGYLVCDYTSNLVTSSIVALSFSFMNNMSLGGQGHDLNVSETMEVEAPSITPYFFTKAQKSPPSSLATQSSVIAFQQFRKGSNGETAYLNLFCSAADDFSLNFFLFAPQLFVRA